MPKGDYNYLCRGYLGYIGKTRTKGISIHDRQYQVHQMHQMKLLASN